MIFPAKSKLPKPGSAPVYQTELVQDSDVLIVSFSGLFGFLNNKERPFDFFMTAKMLAYNRILIRDPYNLFYLRGVDENGFEHLLERFRADIKKIQPRKIIFIGASAGGFAAVLFGHLLGADYIHAFGTRVHFKISKIIQYGDIKSLLNRLPTIFKLTFLLPPQHRCYLDLKSFLKENINPNPNTKTNLHACAYCVDAARANYLKDIPNTRIFLYPCEQHNVAAILLKSQCLHYMLLKQNLDTPEDVYKKFYGDFDPSKPLLSQKLVKADPL